MTVLSLFVKITALVGVVVAIGIRALPNMLYEDLPPNLSLDLAEPTTIVITGANSGLGLATVQHFAHNEHATIIMACRSMERCEMAQQQIMDTLGKDVVQATLRPMTLDISDRSSVEHFANLLEGQSVHILINNAGVAGTTPELTYNKDTAHHVAPVEHHLRVNHLGAVHLTHCLWNNLKKDRGARVVMVSSLAAQLDPSVGWHEGEEEVPSRSFVMYGRSKRANLMFAAELHAQFHDSNISIVAAHPGFTQTSLCKNGCKGKTPLAAEISNAEFLNGIIKMTADDGALSQAYAAVLPKSLAGAYVGPSLALVGEPKIVGSLHASWHHIEFSRDESKLLWFKSLKALGIQHFGENEVPREE